ncbi:polynucleotide 3'-phosphatase [Desmophyllum pertusum]|uniref:Tripeptidyl-peptidase 1 n=1 Tax=Desmophyllum pertusum TaxID=174260 RepID=A0A9X0D7K3_9CNID|nr:polynucleotide 3'-phosphatase [Desmophyllum pertusum]
MEGGKFVCVAFFLAFLALCAGKPQEYVFLESSHDVEAWRVEGWEKQERLSPSEEVFLTFALKQSNLELLERFFWEVSDPRSSEYGNHFSLSNLTRLIEPSQATLTAVKAWLGRHGVRASDCATILTKDFMTCRMPCEAAEAMLVGAKFYRFRHSKLSKPVIRSVQLYTVPRSVAPYLDFVGGVLHFPAVNGPSSPRLAEHEFFNSVESSKPGDNLHIGVFPSVLRERYNVSDVIGTHPNNSQSVAQFLEQYYAPGDLSEFFTLFGSSFKHLEKMTKVIGPDSGRSGIEASLDTQYIMSLGAMVPTWFWSTAGRHASQEPFLEWILDISNRSEVPWVHSISYSDNEDTLDVAYMNRLNVEFQKAGVRGLTFLFASGDNGAGCKKQKFRPMYPSSSPYVTTVGGTAFNDPFTVSTEYAYGISGGGFSNIFPRPSYQTDVVKKYLKSGPNIPPASYFNANGRGFPDISALCNHFWIVNNRIPVPGVMGTSASTPTVAGIISLINDARLHNKKSSMGFLNPFLYQNAGAMYDVTTGHNEGCLDYDTGFFATTGWDAVTGSGSPNFPALVKAAVSYQ